MKLRWILPPLAALCVGGVVWVARHGNAVTATTLFENAKEHVYGDAKDPRLALHELDEALRLADPVQEAELHQAILRERSLLYRSQALSELALGDCQASLAAHGPDVDTLLRASELALALGDSSLALEFARALEPLDPAAAQSRIGRCQVALADIPLAALENHARSVLSGPEAAAASALAQRATVFAGDPATHTAALEELTDLFHSADDRRRANEWVREASERLESARSAFVQSLTPGSSADAVAGLQDLFLRGGAAVDAVELGLLALTSPALANAMPVLARTASALVSLERLDTARALILDQRKRNPAALRPQLLPSHALRDELREWCFLVERLELWDELRTAAGELLLRGNMRREPETIELAHFLNGLACLRKGDLRAARLAFDALGTNPLAQHDIPTRLWLARAELGRRQKQQAQERYALLLATSGAPLDPGPPLSTELGQGWLRLSELRQTEGELAQALECLTHAMRLLPARFAEFEPLWNELGKKAFATRGKNPFALYTRARNALERKQYGTALSDGQSLLGEYPGLGPALELVSLAAFRLHDYGLALSTSLELLERGWPAQEASARLRALPEAFFLPNDRLRWMRLDPRASVVPIVEHLRARGDLQGAARAARTAQLEFQPPEDLVRLARAEFEADLPEQAQETLARLPPASEVRARSAGLLLRVAGTNALRRGSFEEFAPLLTAVLASGRARDPELLGALELLLATQHLEEAGKLATWLVDSAPDFLGEALLRSAVHELIVAGPRARGDARERAAALLEDGRAELGRLFAASDAQEGEALAREARAQLAQRSEFEPGVRAALLVLAGESAAAAEELAGLAGDGRALLAELALEVLATLAPEALVAGDGTSTTARPLAAETAAALEPTRLLVLGLAAHSPPWNAWALARTRAPELAALPWVRLLRARAAAAFELAGLARHELGDVTALGARGAWLAARIEEHSAAPARRVSAYELDWLRAAGASHGELPGHGALQARLALADGHRAEALALLEQAASAATGASEERRLLAELLRADGQFARAVELLAAEHAASSSAQRSELLLPFLDVLREAREAGQLSEARWWNEVEALEAEHARDPAPTRELARRAFEQASSATPASATRASEMLARLRERTLGRGLESLRPGEGLRWVQLLARYSPRRGLELAREELELAPLEPELWRALAEAQLAANDWTGALDTLETIHAVAPEREAVRLLALTAFRLDSDAREFQQRLAELDTLDDSAHKDPLLAFYRRMAELRLAARDAPEPPESGMELWSALAAAGLGEARHGRAFAIALFESGKRGPALQVLERAEKGAESALEHDLFEATRHLMKAGPERPRVLTPLPAEAAQAVEKAPAKEPPAGAKKPAKAASKKKGA